MGWRTVMVTQHAKITYSMKQIVIQTDYNHFQIPIDDIQVLLVATVQAVISTMAISELATRNIKLIFTGRDGEPTGELTASYPNNRSNGRIARQFEWPIERQQVLWTKLVGQKIMNQIAVLKFLKQDTESLEQALLELEYNDLSNREAVVARTYFTRLFEPHFSRKSNSAVNAALNYGYSILLATINQEISSTGCLTQLGIHHYSDENQFNLGSDLMEPFRPIVDMWLSQQKFTDFTPDVKIGLVDLLNIELTYQDQKVMLRHAIQQHVKNCIGYLDDAQEKFTIEMGLPSEVSYHAINGHV